ncbi:hypothetical protein FNV43_RR06185 [Rhamnella rubrinervis]|uniref:DNA polymerase delta subunit 4 n=1 Tax=Rhamnella rubrinervis TaxID=2594499 RepID=A0A8K0HE20_9ROSA|nr:hypothetical protein FNV43_RR06185 [Rhamnella rubrinervis]
MATTSNSKGSMKGFYRQKKKSGITKPSPTKTSKKSPKASATLDTQPADLLYHGSPDLQDDYDEKEDLLRQFDMNMAYGPCVGITRLARWERACKLGLNPPEEIGGLLKAAKVRIDCLWDGRL